MPAHGAFEDGAQKKFFFISQCIFSIDKWALGHIWILIRHTILRY